MGLFFSTSMHSFPIRTTGHDFLHSCQERRWEKTEINDGMEDALAPSSSLLLSNKGEATRVPKDRHESRPLQVKNTAKR